MKRLPMKIALLLILHMQIKQLIFKDGFFLSKDGLNITQTLRRIRRLISLLLDYVCKNHTGRIIHTNSKITSYIPIILAEALPILDAINYTIQ